MRGTLTGVGAWLVACGTEHIELGPGRSSMPDGASEGSPNDPGTPAPAGAPRGLGDQSVSPTDSSEEALRALHLVADEGPGAGGADVTPTPWGEEQTEGCAKVDLLFVVDNSLSMRDMQTVLAQSFPDFIQFAQKSLGSSDFHIMVVDTDGRSSSELLRDSAAVDADLCEEMRGAGRRFSETGDSCNFASERPFIVRDQPELEQTFACVAQVGTKGSAREHPVDALLDALSPALNEPGGCNAGFLRDDAVLFIAVISDEDDRRSAGDPADWQSQVLLRKAGNLQAVVTLGIVADGNLSGGVCRGLRGAPRLQAFAEGLGLIGSVCAEDYSAVFQQAVSGIAERCADFAPAAAPP